MDRKKITEWIKWFIWVGSVIGMLIAWRVDKARDQIESKLVIQEMAKDLEEIKQDVKETKTYVFENKDNITRLTTLAELRAE